MATSAQVIGNRYELQRALGRGGMGAVYKANDRLTGQTVALKRLTFHEGGPWKVEDLRMSMASEFRALASLRHPNIINVLDFGFDQVRQPYFTMELLDRPRTIVEAAHGQSQTVWIDLALQLLGAIAYLHQRGIIHRDLKPDNVLVITDPDDNLQVKVVDFGLIRAPGSLDTFSSPMVGTLGYMAPELLRGKDPSVKSDIYALGVLAYEILVGRPMITAQDIMERMRQVLRDTPNLDIPEIPAPMRPIIQRAIARDPAVRYESVRDLTHALQSVVGKRPTVQVVEESYLEAARFVGRRDEIQDLRAALFEMIAGRGSLWLVAGESGVGKSRLVSELRNKALVEGVQVHVGQAIAEGAPPFFIFRDVLRKLVLATDITDDQASSLRLIIKDLQSLLRRPVFAQPDLAPDVARHQLINTIALILLQQDTPTLLILEDMHWAEASVRVLERLASHIQRRPLMIVVTYQAHERPTLASRLPEARQMTLQRFDEAETTQLVEAMTGAPVANDDLRALIYRETEGNAYFIVETVRALANSAGNLSDIGQSDLPNSVFLEGAQALVDRRLHQMPASARHLLEIAAVAGRLIDLHLLSAIADARALALSEQWFLDCAGILDVQDEQWRFSHERFRIGILRTLDDATRRRYHRDIATIMSDLYADDPDYVGALLYHWGEAGDRDQRGHYARLVGKQALLRGDYADAYQAFTLARDLSPADDPHERAALEWRLADVQRGLGDHQQSIAHADQALAYYGQPKPAARRGLYLALVGQLLVHLWLLLRYRPSQTRPATATNLTAYRIGILLSQQLESYIDINSPRDTTYALYTGVLTLNRLSALEPTPELVKAYAYFSLAVRGTPLAPVASLYHRRAEALHQHLAPATPLAQVVPIAFFVRCQAHIFNAQWQAAEADGTAAALAFAHHKNTSGWHRNQRNLAFMWQLRGAFTASERAWNDLLTSAEDAADIPAQIVAHGGLALIALRRDQLDRASQHIQTRTDLIQQQHDRDPHLSPHHWSYLALFMWRRERPAEARRALDQALLAVATPPHPSPHQFNQIFHLLEVCLPLLHTTPDDATLHQSAEQLLTSANRYVLQYPVARPRLHIWLGYHALITDQPDRAQVQWHAALHHARQMQLRYDQALAHQYLGTYGDDDAPAHRAHARDHFQQIGAQWDAARIPDAAPASSNAK